jgi:hypothetical protein
MLAIYAPYKTTTPSEVKRFELQYLEYKEKRSKKAAPATDKVTQALDLLQNVTELWNTASFFNRIKQYYQNVVIEYSLVRKIIIIAVPLFIIITTLSFVDQNIRLSFGLLIDIPSSQNEEKKYEAFYALLSGLWAGLFFTVSGGLLRMFF